VTKVVPSSSGEVDTTWIRKNGCDWEVDDVDDEEGSSYRKNRPIQQQQQQQDQPSGPVTTWIRNNGGDWAVDDVDDEEGSLYQKNRPIRQQQQQQDQPFGPVVSTQDHPSDSLKVIGPARVLVYDTTLRGTFIGVYVFINRCRRV
jgi:hypothetical protein